MSRPFKLRQNRIIKALKTAEGSKDGSANDLKDGSVDGSLDGSTDDPLEEKSVR